MGTMRPSVALLSGGLAALFSAAPLAAQQQHDPYPSTLQFGTGLINIPVAWVSPTNADVFVQTSGKRLPSFPDISKQSVPSLFNTNLSIDTHWRGIFSVGASLYSQNPEYGFFGQVRLLKDQGFLPSVALGARNIGKFKCEERFLIGHDVHLQADSTYVDKCGYNGFSTAPTLYGVATKEFALQSVMGRMPSAMMSLTLGWGNGLFSDDGGYGKDYNDKGTIAKGLFLGGRVTAHPTLNTTLQVLAENDGWDWNAGIVGDWRGITLGVYGTELEEGGRSLTKPGRLIYNYTKFNLSLGYSGNLIDISRGVILRTRITDLTREQQRLKYEIAARERRIAGLEVALRKAQAGELAEMQKRRQQLENELNAEREEIRKANERLQQIQQGKNPPPSSPSTTPPSTSPSTTPSPTPEPTLTPSR